MSLWRVKHTLSPIVEYALVAVVAAYGLLGIYATSLRPLVIASTYPVTSLPEPVSLAPESWMRHDNIVYGYAYAAPRDWLVDDSDPAHIRLGRSLKEMSLAGRDGEGLLVESVALRDGNGIEEEVAADFVGRRAALYDVSVDGRPAVFAIEFEGARVTRQAVYVQMGGRALVVRAARADLGVFAMFLSNLRFFDSESITPEL